MNKLKSSHDLQFLKDFGQECIKNNWRMVVYGGYGLDAYIGYLTRDHNDLDLVVYGQDDRKITTDKLTNIINNLCNTPAINISENSFQVEVDVNSPGFGLNLYYVQTAHDPFQSLNQVIKSDGTITTNDPKIFPPPQKGSLGDMTLETQDQKSHLKDIIDKGGRENPKYDNDIRLLTSLPSPI